MLRSKAETVGLYIHSIASVPTYVGISALFALYLYASGSPYDALIFSCSACALVVIVAILKILTNVARPKERLLELGWAAFPSGHAAGSMFLTVLIPYYALQINFTLGMFLLLLGVVLTAAISAGRLVIRVHTKVQVIAGLLTGVLVSTWTIYFREEFLTLLNSVL